MVAPSAGRYSMRRRQAARSEVPSGVVCVAMHTGAVKAPVKSEWIEWIVKQIGRIATGFPVFGWAIAASLFAIDGVEP